jgi:hypothetical protein
VNLGVGMASRADRTRDIAARIVNKAVLPLLRPGFVCSATLESLSKELLLQVAGFLDAKALVRLGGASQIFQSVSHDNQLWTKLLKIVDKSLVAFRVPISACSAREGYRLRVEQLSAQAVEKRRRRQWIHDARFEQPWLGVVDAHRAARIPNHLLLPGELLSGLRGSRLTHNDMFNDPRDAWGWT